MSKEPLIIVTRKMPDAVQASLGALGARLNANDVLFSRAQFVEALQSADVLAVSVTDHLDAAMLAEAGPQLKLIANFGVGLDHVDLKAAKEKGIAVTNTPGVLTDDTADIALALILMTPRRLNEGMKEIGPTGFSGWTPTYMMGHCLAGKKLGIVGMGRIGQAVATRAKTFGLEIHYHNRKPVEPAIEKALGARYWQDVDAMISAMDIVSLNCPQTAETKHLISRERLKKFKPSAYLINTARGGIVDEQALADALASGQLAGAGIDVYEYEPKVNPDLAKQPNAVLLPHLGSATVETRTAMGNKVVANIEAFLAGRALPDRVV